MPQIVTRKPTKCKVKRQLLAEWIALGVRPELIRGLSNREIRILLRLFRRVQARRLQAPMWGVAA